MDAIILLAILAVVFGTAADVSYFRELRKPNHPIPNRWSWLIWTFSSCVEVVTFHWVSGDWVKTLPLATTPIACLIILIYVWRLGEDKWENRSEAITDILSVAVSILAVIIWLCFREQYWAHAIAILAIPISYVPYWRNLPKETYLISTPWILWTIMDFLNLTLIIHRLDNWMELPYVFAEILCHASMWFLLSFRHIKHTRRF